ncbi:MAG: xylulokinase [Candidatus Ranarchaeia archaeon]
MFLGIDMGTTGVKVVLYDIQGRQLAAGYQELELLFPENNWVIQDSLGWKDSFIKAYKTALKKSGRKANDILAIGLSGNTPTFCGIDKKGEPTTPGFVWMDRRAVKETQEIADKVGYEEIHKRFGMRLDSVFVLPKIMWLAKNSVEQYNATNKFLMVKDYIAYGLTGVAQTDYTHATGFFAFDVRRPRFVPDYYELFGLDVTKLPEIVPCTTLIGETLPHPWGLDLPAGVPVVTGGIDSMVAGLGIGVTQTGKASLIEGTVSCLQVVTDHPVDDDKHRFLTNYNVLPDQWITSAIINTTGAALRWVRDNIWRAVLDDRRENIEAADAQRIYKIMTDAAEQSVPGSRGLLFLPYLMGERTPIWDPDARGIFFGLRLYHNIGDIVRSVLESSALALLHNVMELSDMDVKIKRYTIAGGSARNRLWNQIKSDALATPIDHAEVEYPENMGAAMLAALGTKQATLKEVEKWVKHESTYYPSENNTKIYTRMVNIYLELYQKTRDLSVKIKDFPL